MSAIRKCDHAIRIWNSRRDQRKVVVQGRLFLGRDSGARGSEQSIFQTDLL
jgi:hypothetical protein